MYFSQISGAVNKSVLFLNKSYSDPRLFTDFSSEAITHDFQRVTALLFFLEICLEDAEHLVLSFFSYLLMIRFTGNVRLGLDCLDGLLRELSRDFQVAENVARLLHLELVRWQVV